MLDMETLISSRSVLRSSTRRTTVRLFCLFTLAHLLMISLTQLAVASEGAFSFRTIEFPGTDSTLALGVNSSGQVVGSYLLAGRQSGFVLSDGSFSTIEYPGADGTEAFGI